MSERPRAVTLESFAYPEDAAALLTARLDLQDLSSVAGESRPLIEALRGADPEVLLVRLGVRVDAQVLDACPSLRCLITPTTGTDHLDLEALAKRRVDVISLRSLPGLVAGVHATAELTWALLLACVRRIPAACAHVAAGSWDRHGFTGMELSGRTLGVIGHGRLGRQVARYGVAFGMRVLVHDINGSATASLDPGVTAMDAGELLPMADVLSLHLPLDPTTRGWLSERRIGMLPQGAVVVNTSRGELIDESAMAAAIRSGHVGGLAVDVVADDASWRGRTGTSALLELMDERSDVVITPHIGGWARDAIATTRRRLVQALIAHLDEAPWSTDR